MAEGSLKVEASEGVVVARFRDNSILDAVTVQRIGRDLHELIDRCPNSRLVLDFRDVRFFSSEALRLLLGLRNRVDKAGSKLALAGLRPDLERIFKLTALDKLFAFYSDADAARTALSA